MPCSTLDIEFTTHFNSSSDLLYCIALARAMAPVEVRPLALRLQWSVIRHEHTLVRSSCAVTGYQNGAWPAVQTEQLEWLHALGYNCKTHAESESRDTTQTCTARSNDQSEVIGCECIIKPHKLCSQTLSGEMTGSDKQQCKPTICSVCEDSF